MESYPRYLLPVTAPGKFLLCILLYSFYHILSYLFNGNNNSACVIQAGHTYFIKHFNQANYENNR